MGQHRIFVYFNILCIIFECIVYNIASIQVSWLRVSDVQVLTVGGLVFSSDPRVQIDVKVKYRVYTFYIQNRNIFSLTPTFPKSHLRQVHSSNTVIYLSYLCITSENGTYDLSPELNFNLCY